MPNLCYNNISINLPVIEFYEDGVGSQAMRQNRWDLMKKLRDELNEHGCEHEMILDVLRPEPKDIGDDWYDWRCDNWGTKWADIQAYELEPDLHLLQLSLETAWGPPLKICDYLTNELGFEVRCIWSDECDEWGVWDYGDIYAEGQIEMWSEDDYDELHELLEDCVDDDARLELLMARGIFGSFESRSRLADSDVEWLEANFRWLYEQTLEKYNEWLENQPHQISLIKLKQEALNHTEKLLEKGEITEGDYLKMCDKLKKITYEQMKLVIKAASGPQMIDYYKKGGEEPKLIDCY